VTQPENNTGTDNKNSDSASRLLSVVKALAAELRPGQADTFKPALDSALDRDLGFDSLAQMELMVRIEQTFGISLPEQVIATADTVRDLLRAVQRGSDKRILSSVQDTSDIKLDEVEDLPLSAQKPS